MKERVPDLLVEQLLLGELSIAQAADVRARLVADDYPRLANLEASNADILRTHPPRVMARRIHARLDALAPEPAAAIRWPLWGTAATLAVAAATILVVARSPETATTPPPSDPRVAVVEPHASDEERIKGPAAIVLRRQRGDRGEPLTADSEVSSGDMIQVGYRAGDWTHGVLVSLDGAGAVTLHFPAEAGASTALQPGRTVTLHGFELDDAPDFERFLLFTANAPLDAHAVIRRVEALAKRPDARTMTVTPDPAEAVVDLPLQRRP